MAKSTSPSPLTANDLAGAQAVIDTYEQLKSYVAKCTDCGMDMTNILAQGKAYADFASQVLQQFGEGNQNV